MFGILMIEAVGECAQLASRTGAVKKQLRRCRMSQFEEKG
jgi:hypothetical protein